MSSLDNTQFICLYQFVAKFYDKTIISGGGGGFNQYDDIHVTTQEVHYSPLAL